MKSKLTFYLLILLAYSCTNNDISTKEDNINKYFQAHKEIYYSGVRDAVFPVVLNEILSDEYLEQELLWFKQNFVYELSQQINDKNYSLRNSEILEIIIDNKTATVKAKTYHLTYLYHSKRSLENIQNRFKCDTKDLETIIKVTNKLNEMLNSGFTIGKGWVPGFETYENFTFYFDNSDKIKDIQIEITSGKLTETYDEVINYYLDLNS